MIITDPPEIMKQINGPMWPKKTTFITANTGAYVLLCADFLQLYYVNWDREIERRLRGEAAYGSVVKRAGRILID